MGEMADYYIELGMAQGEDWFDRKPYRPTCVLCGAKGLVWRETQNGWRLAVPRGGWHVCALDPAKEFEDLDK